MDAYVSPPSRFLISSSFMTALPTPSHKLQQPLSTARIPGVNRVDGGCSQRRLYLRERLAFQLQAEQLPAPSFQISNGGREPIRHLLALQLRTWISTRVRQLDVLHRYLSILPTPRRLSAQANQFESHDLDPER